MLLMCTYILMIVLVNLPKCLALKCYSSDMIIAKIYSLQSPDNQKKILEIIFSRRPSSSSSNFLFALKTANLKLFEQFYIALNEHERKRLDEKLSFSKNPMIDCIQSGDFKKAMEAFVCHPDSPLDLYDNLEAKNSKGLAEKMLPFFSVLLTNESTFNMEYCFKAIRSCYESKSCRNANPNLTSQLMILFLQKSINLNNAQRASELLASKAAWNADTIKAYEHFSDRERILLLNYFINSFNNHNNIYLLFSIQKTTPILFDKILSSQNSEVQKSIRDALNNLTKKEAKPPYEWTQREEELLKSFNDRLRDYFLKDYSREPENFAFSVFKFIQSSPVGLNRDKYPNLLKNFIATYLKLSIELNKMDDVSKLLFPYPSWSQIILDAYNVLSKEEKEKLFLPFLNTAAKTYNAVVLGNLKESYPDLFEKVLSSLDHKTNQVIKRLLTVPYPARLNVSNIMTQFSTPFREINAYAAQLVCTETNQRKKLYSFHPTVLQNSELKEFLTLLSLKTPPIKERFITFASSHSVFNPTADHWISGEIEILEQGKCRILIIDSLGSHESKTHDLIMSQCSNVFEELTVFLSDRKRQHSGAGCTVYALKDVQDLYTIGNFLEPKYHSNIFEFVSQNLTGMVLNSGETGKQNKSFPFSVHSCLLPLRFMRSEQSIKLLEETIPGRNLAEQSLAINKKKETTFQSSKKHFKTIDTKERNERITYKLNKMADHVLDYLFLNQFDFAKMEKAMESFSLIGFKKRMAVNSAVAGTASDVQNIKFTKEKHEMQEKTTKEPLCCQGTKPNPKTDEGPATSTNQEKDIEDIPRKGPS